MANILNIEVGILTSDEGPALGSAILAAVGDGAYPDVATACQTIVKVRETIQPDPVTFQKYEKLYAIYRQSYAAVRGINDQLIGLAAN